MLGNSGKVKIGGIDTGKVLDLILTHYKSPWSMGKPFFDMVALQRNIDFNDVRVILINDGEESRLPDELFEGYPFEVKNITIPHGGVSRARNAGIDASDADWVTICDFDDSFMSRNGLHILLTAAKDDRKVMWWSHFIEETIKPDDHSIIYIPHGRDYIFNHGKMFRRSWLVEQELRYCDKLTLHEDVYFNTLTQAVAADEQIGEIESGFYLWAWNGESVSRSFKNMLIETYNHQIRQRIAICRQLEKRGLDEALKLSIVKTIIDGYYDFQKADWQSKEFSKDYRKAERWYCTFLKAYGNIYRTVDPKEIAGMARCSRDYHLQCGGFLMECITLREFLLHMINDVKPIPEEEWDL
jgi:glycosyltransferase involved in cell wall biosynthesis